MNSMGKVSDKQIEQMNNVADIDSMHLLDLVSRMGGSTYARASDRFDLERPSR